MTIGICLSGPPSYSETFLVSKIRGLQQSGFQVKVFILGRTRADHQFQYITPYSFNLFLLPFWFPFVLLRLVFFSPRQLRRLVLRERKHHGIKETLRTMYWNAHVLAHKLDWIHFEFLNLAIGRENLAYALGARMSASLRGYDISIYPLKHRGCYQRVWLNIDKVHTISDDLYRKALQNGLSPAIKMAKIMPAVSTEGIRIKSELGSIGSPIKILTTGRLEWKKGYYYALQAIKLLHAENVRIEYTIVGDGAQKEELQFLIQDMGLAEVVRLAGRIGHQDVLSTLCDYDIYLQPSVQEGFCNALLEAQAAGLLCIATDAEGLRENVINGQTGWIVPRRDFQSMADKVLEVVAMAPQQRSQVAGRAAQRARQEFGIDRLVKQFDEFYRGSVK